MRVVTGIQPSGRIHLGNYFGAIAPILDLQKENETFIFVADFHALTSSKDGKKLKQNSLDLVIDLLALGVDPIKSCLFKQSYVPQVTELSWYLGTLFSVAALERAHAYKDKIDNGLSANVGLFTYPILMAADILAYNADYVPVGKDQSQHLEIARDLAQKFNIAFVPGYNPKTQKAEGFMLKTPEPLISNEVGVVQGTDGRKMSKTYQNTIDIFASDKVVEKQIKGIKTDSSSVEDPKDKNSSLYSLIYCLADSSDIEALNNSFESGGLGYGYYKAQLLYLFHKRFDAARNRRKELESDLPFVYKILQDNADRARLAVLDTLHSVRGLVGVGL